MAISVVCSGCQSHYQVAESLAGKRAKCKKCGAAMQVPAAASSDLSLFDDLDGGLTPLPNAKPQPKPKVVSSAYSDDLDDPLGLSSATLAPAALGAPVKYATIHSPGAMPERRSGASIAAAIAATLLSLCGAGIIFFALLCTGDWQLGLGVGGVGIVAAIACCALGIMRMPGMSWSVFALYSVICLLGIGKAGYNVYRVPAKVREMAEKARADAEARRGGPFNTGPSRTWTPPSDNDSPTTPTPWPANNNTNNGLPTVKPWTPPSGAPQDLKQPRTDDWKATLDPPPEWAKVGEGRDFSLVLDQPGWNPIKHSTGYSRSIAFQHQLGGQDVFEVWDLGKRRKVGQLRGKNGFHREICLSPDGKYVAGEVRPESGGFHGPIQVWSIAAAQKVCEVAAPANDRDVDILDFTSPETLMAVYRRGDSTLLKVWNVADGSEKQNMDLGKEHIDRRRYVFSPGRKYFVTFENQQIRFFDLEAGSQQGIIYLPSGCRCEGLSYSPDGTEIAALCDVDWKGTVFVWNALTGEMKSQVKLEQRAGELVDNSEKIGGQSISWLSTGEGWLFGGKKVLSRKDGKLLWTLPDVGYGEVPAKMVDTDQMISVEKIGNSTKVTMRGFPFGEMDSVNKALAAGGAAIDSKLPPLGKPDVSAVKELDMTTGAAWTVAADPRPGMKTGTGNKPIALTADRLQGVLFSSPSQAQVVSLDVDARSPENTELSPQVISYLSRFDLQTSKSIVRQKVPGGSQLLAISPSGNRAALTIGSDEGRIDVYSLAERGELLCAWRPYLEENPKVDGSSFGKQHSRQSIQWAGFIDEDHVLTMNRFDGQLVLWKLPEMKAVYRLRTGTSGGGELSPTGKYLIVRGKDRFSIIESRTGQICGELPTPFEVIANNENVNAAFSADGTRLAVTVPDITGPFLLAYDFRTGTELARMPLGHAGAMQWCGARQLLVGGQRSTGGGVRLVDIDRRATVWRYTVMGGYRLPESPDDRVWLIAGGYNQTDAVLVAQPFQLSNEVTTAIGTLPFNPPALFGPGTAVSIDASGVGSAGSPDLAERVKQTWATNLAARGARVGEGGLKLVASTSSGASRTEQYTPSRFGFPFPGRSSPSQSQSEFSFTTTDINLQVQLLDSAGKKLWETKSVAAYHLPYSVQSNSQDKSPQQIMSESQTAAHRSGTDGFFLGVRLPFMIYPQPTDKDGHPGLGDTFINLTGYNRDKSTVRPIEANTAGTKESIQAMYEKVLADNADVGSTHWQWCQGLDRPVVALRWGLGVQMDMKADAAKVELRPTLTNNTTLRDLERAAGPIGPSLVQMLRAKQSEGKFGTFAGVGDDNMREVMLLGTGERAQLAAAARKAAVDLVLIIKLEPITKGRQRDAQLSLEILDLASGKKLWTSEAVLESRVKAAKAAAIDLLGDLALRTGEDIDAKLALTPLDTMPAGTPALRAEGTLHRANPLAAIAEIDLYLCREKIPAATATAAFAKVLGSTSDAADLAAPDVKKREAAISKIVSMLADKML